MKNEWGKPEVGSLGIKGTSEDISTLGVDPGYIGAIECGFCHKNFDNVAAYEAHKTRVIGVVGKECPSAPNDPTTGVEDSAMALS